MPPPPKPQHPAMLDLIGEALAKVEGRNFSEYPVRYRQLAVAALKPLAKPTEAMIDAAHEAVWFDNYWAINNRRDYVRAVRAMIAAALKGQ